jgi:ATP-binding cassette subfamily F protein 3
LEQRRHMEAFVERFRAKATKARQAQSRLKALEKMEPIPEAVEDRIHPFSVPNPGRPAAPPIATMTDASFAYEPGHPVLQRLNLTLGTDDRVGLLGRNGNGKSTLAQLIAGRLEPQSGSIHRAGKIKVGYFAQHQLDELNPSWSAFDHVRVLMDKVPESQVRARAGALGFPERKMDTPTDELSGGEKARLLLGLAAFGGVHLLILDEPTNHLDIGSREMLIQALNDYSGALIIISHDRHLLDATVDRLWLVADGGVRSYDGSIDDYQRLIIGGDNAASSAMVDTSSSAQQRRRESAQRRKETAPLRQQIKEAETTIARLQQQIRRIDTVLADPKTHIDGAAEELVKQTTARAKSLRDLEAAEDRWLRLSEQLEQGATD